MTHSRHMGCFMKLPPVPERVSTLWIFCWAAGFLVAGLTAPVLGATSSLNNGTVQITVDLNQGGGIVAFHPTGQPQDSVINTYDRGRNCQQSYYAGPAQFNPNGATQNPNWNPWPWNPVQGGDNYGNGSSTISWSNDGTTLYVKSRPKQWALQNQDADCLFEQWITLSGSVATVRNRLINARSDTTQYQAMHQELGALYTWRALSELWTYSGTQPFTGGALTNIPKTGPPWAYFRATEGWAAYTKSSGSKWGVGILLRGNCYFIGGFDGSTSSGTQSSANTGYLAPIRSEVIDHNIVYEYTYQLILGNLADIRSYAVSQQVNLKPNFFFRGTRSGWTYYDATDSGYPFLADRLRVNVNGSDPQLLGPECSFQAAEVPKLYIRAAYHCASGTTKNAELFWERENGASPMSDTQRQSFTVINDGQFRMYVLDLSTHTNWTGQISRLRFDPVPGGSAGDYVEVLGITSTPPGVSIEPSGGSTAVSEAGATDTYTVVLTSQPTSDVTITPSPGSQLAVSPASLTFTVANWSTPQTVSVAAINDAIAEGTHSATITHTAASSDPGYNGLAIPNVTASITDDTTQAQSLYDDNFTLNLGGLNGRTTAAGFGNWVTSDSALQTGGGLLTVGSNLPVDYHAATFPLPTLSGADVLKISITTRPVGTFLGIGFTPGPAQFVNGTGLCWLYIDAVGVQIFRGYGSNDRVYLGSPAGFNASFPTTYTFTYNPTGKTMGLKAANGSSEFEFFSALDIAGLPPLRNFALMFQGQNLATDANPSYVSNIRAEVLTDASGNYAGWLTNYPALGSFTKGTDDPDGDGMNNSAEFAFGTSPVSGSSQAVTLSAGSGTIKLSYLQRKSGATYTVKSLPDLTTPFDSGTTLASPNLYFSADQNNLPSSDYERYEATLSTGSTKGFLRVRAVVP